MKAKQKKEKMDTNKKIAIIVGVLFIAESVVYMIGSTLTEGILNTPDYLIKLAENKNQVITGVLLEAIVVACLVFIGVMMYSILKRHSKTIARGYFGIRIIEAVITVGYLIIHLLFFALSKAYVKAGAPDASYFQTLGVLLEEGLNFAYQIHIIFYGLGFLMLFGLLFKAKLVPQFISIGGLITTVLMLTGLVFDMYGFNLGMEIYASPVVLCQIFLAIWLIVKGFNSSAIASEPAKGDK